MDLAFAPSKAGAPYAKAGSILLHSAYDPVKEAERFLDACLEGRSPSCFILSGPCLDYLSPLLRARFPAALILAIQHDGLFRSHEASGHADATWYPDLGQGIEAFLSARLDEDALGGVQILEWPPAARAWPEEAARMADALRTALDRLASSAATLKVFGRRWIGNACRNFLLLESTWKPRPTNLPIVIAAAGPSLADSLELLRPHRDAYVLMAVSSALTACLARGLLPDLLVATDGGHWSRQHLFPLSGLSLPTAMPLTALPSASLSPGLKALLLDQGNFPEAELLFRLGGGFALPSHGTVVGSAIHLAARLGSGKILLAGMDLATLGSLSHARPHGFDSLTRDAQARLSPEEGLVYSREAGLSPIALPARPWRSSRSLETYAAALSGEAERPPLRGRLYRLLPSPIALPSFASLGAAGLSGLLADLPAGFRPAPASFEEAGLPAPSLRRELLRTCIQEWRVLAREAALSFEGGRIPAEARARELLRAIDLPWWAAACRLVAAGKSATAVAGKLLDEASAFLAGLEERLL
jgi:hypothetical protein